MIDPCVDFCLQTIVEIDESRFNRAQSQQGSVQVILQTGLKLSSNTMKEFHGKKP